MRHCRQKEAGMNLQRIFGAALLIVGIVLFLVGMNSSHSFADQVSNTFSGRFTQATTWYILVGVVSGLGGLATLIFGSRIGE